MIEPAVIFPEVVQVVACENHCIKAYFEDGAIRLYSVAELIQPGSIFEKLSDAEFFCDRLTVMNGTVAWDVTGTRDVWKCLDIDAQVIYEQGEKQTD